MSSAPVRLLQVIKDDHKEIYSYYAQYVKNEGNALAQQQLSSKLTWEIARHSLAEEQLVHPLFEKYLKDGKEKAKQDREEHQALKDSLSNLAAAGSPRHASQLEEIIKILKTHTAEEERDDLPLLESKIGEDVSAKAAINFLHSKSFVPNPPFASLADLLGAPTDKAIAELAKFISGYGRATVETKN